jgi:hypothetical protein
MPVDPTKPRKILIIHGVQTENNAVLNQDKLIEQLLMSRLGNLHLNFETDLFRYEDLNDQTQIKYQNLIKLFTLVPVGGRLLKDGIDLVGDVVTAKQDTSTAAMIRQGFKNKILAYFDAGNPCYIVAHSLGTIYAFDVINELIKDRRFFDQSSRKTWPVQAMITLGSPIGLNLFRKNRPKLLELGEGKNKLRWLNYWDRTDPVVSGKIFGQNIIGFDIAEKYLTDSPTQGWVIRDIPVDTGRNWLMAHVAYWENPMVGDGLFTMVTS